MKRLYAALVSSVLCDVSHAIRMTMHNPLVTTGSCAGRNLISVITCRSCECLVGCGLHLPTGVFV